MQAQFQWASKFRRTGTSKTLIVDTAGKLQYSTPEPSLAGAISLALVTAKNGNLTAKVEYKVPGFIDTTVTVPRVYTFSNDNNTASITHPNPQNGLQSILIFQRSSIGAVVKPRKNRRFAPSGRNKELQATTDIHSGTFATLVVLHKNAPLLEQQRSVPL